MGRLKPAPTPNTSELRFSPCWRCWSDATTPPTSRLPHSERNTAGERAGGCIRREAGPGRLEGRPLHECKASALDAQHLSLGRVREQVHPAIETLSHVAD